MNSTASELTAGEHQIVALWAHPRSLSTALERIFIERGDFAVRHEPFSAVYYLGEQRAAAVKATFVSQPATDYRSIRQSILQAAKTRPVFFKDMSYHCHDHLLPDAAFLRRLTNVFLIRHPRQAIASHYAKNPQVTCDEIGYHQLASLFRRVAELEGSRPVVVAAEMLQGDAAGVLRALCRRIGREDRPDALNWQAGQQKAWGDWRAWHEEVAQSNRIHANQTDYADTVENNATLAEFYRHHLPSYQEMARYVLDPA